MTKFAVNPETGETLALIGGQWQPAKLAQNDKGEKMVLGENGWEPMPAPKAPTQGPAAGLSDVVASAMTFGLTNDVAGATRALGPAARFLGSKVGLPVEYKEGEVADAYRQGRDNSIRKIDAYRDANPWTAFGGDVVGGMANPASRIGMAKPGASMLQRALLGGGTGAGMGAAYGFGNAEGDLGDRAQGAAGGALVGGAVGAAAPGVVDTIGKGLRYIGDQTIGRMGAANQGTVAARKVAEALQRDGLTPTQAAQRIVELGPDAALADVGPNSQALAGAISRAPGQGRSALTDFVTRRQEGVRDASNVLSGSQSQRIMAGIDGLIPNQADDILKSAASQRAKAGGNYEAAKNAESIGVDTRPLIAQLDTEIRSAKGSIRSGLEKVRGFLVDTEGRPETTIDALHQAKMAIDDLMSSGDARNSMGRVAQGRVKDYQTRLLAAIEGEGVAGAEYATGRGATAAAWRTQEALESGAAFMSRAEFGNVKEMAASLSKMAPDDLHAFRVGAAQAIKGKLDNLNVRSDATKRVMDIPALEDKVRAAFGDQQTFKRYIDMLKGERQMFGTYGEVTGNSRTAARQLADADLNQDPGRGAQSIMDIAASPLNPMTYLRAGARYLGDAKAKLATPEPVRNQIASLLMANDPLSAPQLGQAMGRVQMNERTRRALAQALLGGGASVGGYTAP